MRSFVIVLWLTLVWVTLWEALTWANVLGGLLVSAAVISLLPPRRREMSVGFRPLAALRLLFYFLWELVLASAQIVWEVLTPRDRTSAGVVSVRTRSQVPGHVTAVASMISLIPGTLSLEVDGETMTIYIHVLHLRSFEDTRASVHELEDLTLAAFPPRAPRPGEVST
jgi:multicomponent Na+:H+ antiporter subunit E